MAYDEDLARRMRQALNGQSAISEKRMMGGNCFCLSGTMLCGADCSKDGAGRFMFRVGKGNLNQALERPGATVMELRGKEMSGFVLIAATGSDDDALNEWIALAETFVGTLPAK